MKTVLSFVLAALAVTSCKRAETRPGAGADVCTALAAKSWPEADALFQKDPTWIGADAAYSIDLGNQRILWLFGDTFLAKTAQRSRTDAWFVRNSVAIQSGSYDPSRASAAFAWGTPGSSPSSFFPESGSTWFWPLSGARLPSRLTLFLLAEHAVTGGFGFEATGTKVVFVSNPADDPARWSMTDGNLPAPPFPVSFGAAVVVDGPDVYAFSVKEPGDHAVYVARMLLADLDAGDASKVLWWAGKKGWIDTAALGGSSPEVIFPSATALDNPPTELSVQKRADGTWLAVHSVGFGATRLVVRTSRSPTGPWSPLCDLFTPPESGAAGVHVYAGKGHAELLGGELITTYATNTTDNDRLARDLGLYFPRFVKTDRR